MNYRKKKHRFLVFLLALAMVSSNGTITFPTIVHAQEYVPEMQAIWDEPETAEMLGTQEILSVTELSEEQEAANASEMADMRENDALPLSAYTTGQGETMQIYMLDPSPSNIQTAGLITAQEAGLSETIASDNENVYYNIISERLDSSNEMTFRILASGQGLNNQFPSSCIENKLTVYDSDQKIVYTDVASSFGEYTDTELSGVTINDKFKKAMLFTYPRNILKGDSTYYLVVSGELQNDNGKAVLGTKVVFCFTTKEASGPSETYYNVNISGNGAEDVQGNKTVSAGSTYTFTMAGNPYYIDYMVTASVNGVNAELEKNGTGDVYTIKNVNGDVDITVKKRIKSAEESPLKYGEYKAGQGSRSVQLYMLDPVSTNIQTAGRIPAETAGLGKIAKEFEEVYYNQILEELDPKQDITFKVLAAGAGVGNGLRSDAICNIASIYDSDMKMVSVNASYPGTYPLQESCDAEFTVDNNEARHKKSTSVIYPANTFESDAMYYLVLNETFCVNNGGILGNKVIFCFKTKAAPEPEKRVYDVVFTGNGATDASGAAQAEEGSDYTFTVAKKVGYDYTIKVTMRENAVTGLPSSESDGNVIYTVKKVAGNLVITVERAAQKKTVAAKIGSVLTDSTSKARYKVTKSGRNVNGAIAGAEVAYTRPLSRAASVTIPNTVAIKGVRYKVTSIADQAFHNDKVITKVKLGSNVSVIGKNAFSGCKKLQSVTIGKNVTAIREKAFYKCGALNKVTIPAKVTKIGKLAFYGCKKLRKITIKTTKLVAGNVGNKVFVEIHKKAVIKVPKKKLAAYKKFLKKKGVPKEVKIR